MRNAGRERGLRDRPVPRSAALGLAVAAPPLAWWAIGPLGAQWPDHDLGPYYVPLAIEAVAAAFAIVIAVASALMIVADMRGRIGSGHSFTVGATAFLVGAGIFAAACWRVQTAGAVGANIGAGVIFLLGPLGIAGLLVGAVLCNAYAEPDAGRPRMRWLVIAALTALVFYAFEFSVR